MEQISASELLALVTENQHKVKLVELDKGREARRLAAELHHIRYDVYDDKIEALEKQKRELEQKRDLDIETAENLSKTFQDGKQAEIIRLLEPRHRLKRILDYLRIKVNVELKNVGYGFRPVAPPDKYFEDLGYWVDDPYLKAKIFIYENNKPTNKYTLCIAGHCAFVTETMFEKGQNFPNHSLGISDESYFQLGLVLKEGTTVQFLKDWLVRKQATIVKDYGLGDALVQFKKLKIDYEQVLAQYKPEDFKYIWKYVCDKCGHFLAEVDDYSWQEPIHCYCGEVMHKTLELQTEEALLGKGGD